MPQEGVGVPQKKMKRFISILIAGLLCVAMPFSAIAADDKDAGITFYETNSYSPTVKKVNGTWYYYINGEQDLTYTGLAYNDNGQWYCKEGIVDFTYDWTGAAGGTGVGGWYIDNNKVYFPGHTARVTSGTQTSSNPSIVDDNAFSGRLIIGDSRIVHLYEYPRDKTYTYSDQASFVAVWGGNYTGNDSTKSINSSARVSSMKSFIKESLQMRGYCDVYLETTVNEYNGSGDYTTPVDEVIDLADTLQAQTATFNGTKVKPNIIIIGLVGKSGASATGIANYNSYLKTQAAANGYSVMDISGCLTGDYGGYDSGGTHYNNDTMANIWAKILDCPHDYKTYTKAATCTATGWESNICIKCGDVASTTTLDKKDHTWDNGTVTKSPTVSSTGTMTYTCTVCGATKTETIAALECTHSKYTSEVTSPTCTAAGYTTYTCSECGYVWTGNNTNALGHNYTSTVTAPTCTNKGYTTYVCSRCNDTYKDNETDALGHNYTSTVTSPTCTAKGYTTHTCTRCGDTYKDSETAASGHDYKSVTTAATCTKNGYTTYTCTKCNNTYTGNETSALGHDYESEVTDPTCVTGGYTTYTCTRCNATYKDDETEALGHTWDNGEITIDATCLGEGIRTYTCDKCEETMTEPIEALGHDYESEVTDPTCTENGYTTYTCKRCGDTYTDNETEALGHDAVYVYAVAATATQDGNIGYYYCENCDTYAQDEAMTETISYEDTIIPATGSAATWSDANKDMTAKNAAEENEENTTDSGTVEGSVNDIDDAESTDDTTDSAATNTDASNKGTDDVTDSSTTNTSASDATDVAAVKTGDGDTNVALLCVIMACVATVAVSARRILRKM